MGVEMYLSLMGTFNFATPMSYINSTLANSNVSISSASASQVCYFITTYFEDPWLLPSPFVSVEGLEHAGMAITLSVTEMFYQAIQRTSIDIDLIPPLTNDLYHLIMPVWAYLPSLWIA
jgi:hypothetical protein